LTRSGPLLCIVLIAQAEPATTAHSAQYSHATTPTDAKTRNGANGAQKLPVLPRSALAIQAGGSARCEWWWCPGSTAARRSCDDVCVLRSAAWRYERARRARRSEGRVLREKDDRVEPNEGNEPAAGKGSADVHARPHSKESKEGDALPEL